MALEVIGAGFGRTGTESMKQALEILGLGPCHHMREVMSNPAQLALWRAAARGELPDWDEAFAGYRSAVDWPSAYFWRAVCAHYPEAKVLLTGRSAESWYESMSTDLAPEIGRWPVNRRAVAGERLVPIRQLAPRGRTPERELVGVRHDLPHVVARAETEDLNRLLHRLRAGAAEARPNHFQRHLARLQGMGARP